MTQDIQGVSAMRGRRVHRGMTRHRGHGFSIALTLTLVLCIGEVQALNPDRLPTQYLSERFARDRELPSNTVWVSREAPDGYLWIGTQAGLVRFDGTRFTTFNEHTHAAFQANDIRDLEWNDDGELWIATYGGGAVVMRDGRFDTLGVEDGLAGSVVYDIHAAVDGSIWFATNNGVSRLYRGALQSWTTKDGLAANGIIKIAEQANGDLWFASLTNGLSHFDGNAFHAIGIGNGLDSLKLHLLSRDPELGVVAGTSTGTVYQLRPDRTLTPVAWKHAVVAEEMLVDRDGNRWMGSYGKGLWRIADDGQAELFELGIDSASAHIFSLSEDNSGSIWVSSSQGLFRIRDSEFLQLGKYEGLTDSTFVVTGDDNGTLWIGSEGRGLFRVDSDGGISQPHAELIDKDISALLARNNGEVWVGTFGDGLFRIKGGMVQHLDLENGLSSRHVFALQETLAGEILIGTNSGVNRWQEARPTEMTPLGELESRTVRHIYQGGDGRVWFSTNDGLYEYGSDRVRRWGMDQGLVTDVVICTYEDERGVLWIVTRDGSIARLEGESLFSFDQIPELQRLSAFSLLQDQARQFWIAGSTGLLRVSRDSLDAIAQGRSVALNTRLFSESDGLRSSQFVGGFQPAAWAGPDDRLWFATARGLTSFDPRQLAYEYPVPRTFIEAVRVNGAPVPLVDPLVLPATIRGLEIDYSAPDLRNASSLNFRYSLSDGGIWESVGGRRTAYFTSLPAGERVFSVQAMSGKGAFTTLGPNTAQLTIIRRPRWFETTWSVLAGSIALIALLTVVQRQLSRRAREREQQLRELVETRTEELSEALKQVEANSRIDSLTGIANRRHMDERLAAVWKMAQRSGAPVSIIMVDIDRFKEYNDSLGHKAGDQCLRRIALAISDRLLREHDMVARYGGEEFVVVLYDSDEEGAKTAAQRIMECVRLLALPHPRNDVADHVTVSIGHATGGPNINDGAYALIDLADQAMYRAKNSGRNRVTGFTDSA